MSHIRLLISRRLIKRECLVSGTNDPTIVGACYMVNLDKRELTLSGTISLESRPSCLSRVNCMYACQVALHKRSQFT